MMRIPLAVCLLVVVVYSGTRADARATVPALISVQKRVWKLTEADTIDEPIEKRSGCGCLRTLVNGKQVCPPCHLNCQCGYVQLSDTELGCKQCGCECGTCRRDDGSLHCCSQNSCECPCGVCETAKSGGSTSSLGTADHCCSCCFPGNGRVSLESGKSVAMSELTRNHLHAREKPMVSQDGSITYTEVRTFMEKIPNEATNYKSFRTFRNNTLSLSTNHLMYARKHGIDKFNQIQAEDVSVGDEVLVRENGKMIPTMISGVKFDYIEQGAYVPVTMAGNIIVDGVLASCYAFTDHHMAHIGMTPIRWFPQITELIFGMKDGVHGYVTLLDHLGNWVLTNEVRHGRSSLEKNVN